MLNRCAIPIRSSIDPSESDNGKAVENEVNALRQQIVAQGIKKAVSFRSIA
jgi:hypothetical protein